jgi:beta-glucosidase
LYETYLPAFKKLVTEARVESVMGAYNRTNGEPCCASQFLLQDILRGEWKFEGHVVSDCWALADIHLYHKVTKDAPESAALALSRGCDLACGTIFEREYFLEAMDRGLISEGDLDQALERTLATRFKLGLFDPEEQVPYAATAMSVVGSQGHQQLAYEAAAKSVVLLKNQGNLLPLKNINRMFLTGPSAASTDVLLGNYYGLSDSLTTILEGIAAKVPEGTRLEYRPGAQVVHPNRGSLNYAIHEAGNCQVTIACMGLHPMLEGEEGESILSDSQGDRDDIVLPQAQIEFVKALVATGTKVVLVLTGGSAMALGGLEDLVEAVLWIGYPGQAGGKAVAEVLFGQVSPSGRLPITFYKSLDQLPPYHDYSMQGRTYRYFKDQPLYPFGFGLSYTRFAYSDLRLAPTLHSGQALKLSFALKNLGEVSGQEVVQVYLSDLEASVEVPRYSLVGFKRLELAAGESRQIEFSLAPEQMMIFNNLGQQVLEPGRFAVEIGGCSPGKRGRELGACEPLSAEFSVIQ